MEFNILNYDVNIILGLFMIIVAAYTNQFFQRTQIINFLNIATAALFGTLVFETFTVYFANEFEYLTAQQALIANICLNLTSLCGMVFTGMFNIIVLCNLGKDKKISKKIIRIHFVLISLLILSVILLYPSGGYAKFYEEAPVYRKSAGFILGCITQIIMFVLDFIALIIKRNELSKSYFSLLSSGMLILIGLSIFRYLVPDAFFLYATASSLVTLSYILLQDSLTILDPKTKIFTRKILDDYLSKLEKENFKDYSIVYLELSDYEYILEKYGESKKDEALLFFANALKNSCTDNEKVVYTEDDEFLIFVPSTKEEKIFNVLKKVNQDLLSFPPINGEKINLKYRFEITKYDESLKTFPMVIRKSSAKIYEHKHSLNFISKEID